MSHRKVIEKYYVDVSNLSELLTKLVSSYRLSIGGAAELNQIAPAKKSEIRKALKRAYKLGDIVDDVIEVFDDVGCNYMNYCRLKAQIIKCKIDIQCIESEVDDELKLKD